MISFYTQNMQQFQSIQAALKKMMTEAEIFYFIYAFIFYGDMFSLMLLECKSFNKFFLALCKQIQSNSKDVLTVGGQQK